MEIIYGYLWDCLYKKIQNFEVNFHHLHNFLCERKLFVDDSRIKIINLIFYHQLGDIRSFFVIHR